jgi:hypothetical protein
MGRESIERLGEVGDLRSIARSVLDLCRPFGPVRSCDCVRLVGEGGAPVVLCFIELEASGRRTALMRELGACAFGEGVCLRIPCPRGTQAES